VQVVQVPDADKAQLIATQWRAGADWAAVQTAATAAGGSAIELDDAVASGLPTAELGRAVFAATPDLVSEPAQGLAGWQILKVTKVTPGSEQSFDQV